MTHEKYQEYSLKEFLKDLWKLLEPYRWKFFLATFLRFISDIVWLYPAYAISFLTAFLSQNLTPDTSMPWWIFGLWVSASLLHYGGRELAKYIGYQVSEHAALDAEYKTIGHLFSLDLSWQEKENSGNKLKRIQKGGEGINKIFRIWIDNCIEIVVNFAGMIGIIAFFDLRVACILSIFLISYFFISTTFTRKASQASNIVNIAEEKLHGLAFEAINNIRSVKVMGMGEALLAIFQKHLAVLFSKIRNRIKWFRMRELILAFWGQGFRFGIVAFIVWNILTGQYELNFLVLFDLYFLKIWSSIEELSAVNQDLVIAKYGIARMNEILKEPVVIDTEKGKKAFPKIWKKLVIQNLHFSYGKKQVLKNISLSISRGEKIGIIGISGAGKSTFMKLLLKEDENYQGQILIDNIPLKTIRKSSYFQHAAVVLQDTEVFNFTLRENIVLANIQKAENSKLLQKAIEIAHINEFLDKLPQGVNTYIGEKGIHLSGGEKQRVALARAVFKEPELLFLDEATSHLDVESEAKIQDSLHNFFQSVTAIVIAHRLSTIKEMDRIIVIEKGCLLEEGTFDELYNKKGRFYDLWQKQKF